MVTAAGAVVTADRGSSADLLWASCGGGGGNFGIVTEFTLELVDTPAVVSLATYSIGGSRGWSGLGGGSGWGGGVAEGRGGPGPGGVEFRRRLRCRRQLHSLLVARALSAKK